jgi:hypothetical protein
VIGELACGHPRERVLILRLLSELPTVPEAEHIEVLAFIQTHRLMGLGLGWVDVHLLASSTLSEARLWTLDKKLGQAATRLGGATQ